MKYLSIQTRTMALCGFYLCSLTASTYIYADEFYSQNRQYLLGDWNGKRNNLSDQGIDFNLSFTNETATNIDGGFNDDSTVRNANQWTFGTTLDLEKLSGWQNTQAKISISKRDGRSLSTDRIADPRTGQFSNVQEISGRGPVWRLSQASIQKGFEQQGITVKLGRMNMGEDFNSAPCEFQNLTLCGSQVGKTVSELWYNWPITVWAANIKYDLNSASTLALGVYESNPENTKRSKGFNLSTDGSKGVLIPVEWVWRPQPNGLNGIYRFGAFYSTADAIDVLRDAQGEAQLLAQQRQVHSGKYNSWFVAQQQLTQHSDDPKRGLTLFLNLNINDKATSELLGSQQIALQYKGLSDARPNDSIGLGVSRTEVNKQLRARQRLENEINQITDYQNPSYVPIQYDETNVELNYTFNWSPSVMLRPNLQFVHQAGGLKEIKDAWVFGLTTRLNF
ncbi:carbohydrate porin [Acinetobacter haemolyticus]|uniref:carbohydrate porin n=2 Tax=Acinetobacter haemolyticus TaxID=29430 RepID=UPI001331F795|nr:carbohydrate porin [Acinetobacter haemolyticus]NAR60140.1 carbohydrate porin [Acinetobacter haemolyticus]NAR66498.1 carbohydrate porin [Acinetobacter haemolyticus]NAR82311.1 carbohydrate porin [Acinetobacter haemolyticus]NAR92331.1 carbohydrate porin [Acinetobacter haemolyticus]QHI23285.1 carbohydrate porin [Acinetobacter haemolyticus]